MDKFVNLKLTEWGLSELVETFKDQGIDAESLYCLDDQDIDNLITQVGPRSKFKKRLKLLKAEQQTTYQETVVSSPHRRVEATDSSLVLPSTSGTSNTGETGKRTLLQGESSSCQSPSSKRRCDKRLGDTTENDILTDMKGIMNSVQKRLHRGENTKLNAFLKSKICDLETDKRELVGVFGKTGAGKSSLINAVIGVKNLLPSGSISACTSVMIKVEANNISTKYEAEIEFITKEEWEDELWPLEHIFRDDADQEKSDSEYCEELTALYGEEWRNMSTKNLMEDKHFREIPEFLQRRKKILSCESAKELSAKFVKYTRSDSKVGQGKEVKRWYWPLVKCVTVKVPYNDLLQHVTLVDLPGNGDRNKSRDKMWKELVGRCSTVWIVTEINRAASEREAWEILEDACSLMGNGGECQRIHFICTKSDHIGDSDDHPAADVRDIILKENLDLKQKVMSEFRKDKEIMKHFNEECFQVFTVSSKEFLREKYLQRDDTEIPKLQESLETLNAYHSVTSNYVSGAYGILSLIQGARCREVAGTKTEACRELEENMRRELDKVRKPMEEAYEAFERCLNEGVEKSKSSCEAKLKSILYPSQKRCNFYRTLKSVVQNNGAYKTSRQRQININEKLSSFLTNSIDEKFRKTFPNERECRAFNGAITEFTLDTKRLIQKYREVELQLTFLQTEEEKIKMKLNRIIRKRKKRIYRSLTEEIKEHMQECYKRAATFNGPGVLNNMRDTIVKHFNESKNEMFEDAKDALLRCLNDLKEYVLKELEETLMKSIELSLKTTDDSIPDVSAELDLAKRHYNEIINSPDGETSPTG